MSPFKQVTTDRYPLWQMQAVGDTLLRPEDQRELASCSGSDAGLALVEAVMSSKKSWVCFARDNHKIVCVWGYALEPTLDGVCIWVAGTSEIFRLRHEFTSMVEVIVENFLNRFGTIYNLIDLRNVTHIQWLTKLGFELPPDKQVVMKDGSAFQYFYKEK